MFHEIDQDKIDRVRGMDITFVTSATNDEEGRALLRRLGFPFKAPENDPKAVALARLHWLKSQIKKQMSRK